MGVSGVGTQNLILEKPEFGRIEVADGILCSEGLYLSFGLFPGFGNL